MVQLITAEDVRAAARAGARSITVEEGAIVTPLARDEAQEREVTLTPAPGGRVAPGPPVTADGTRSTRTIKRIETRGLELEAFPFPVPPAMDVRLRDVVTAADGAPVAAGVMSFREGSFPWELTYDEVQFVLEGELHLGTEDGTVVGRPGDVLYVPEGTKLTFGTPSWARFLYVTYPAEWGGDA
ncbi:cupin domain-containing protein [Nitriliruptor alkaliphilus]|uniref:cupin domain-containing protein n=1 Tax=Nitriliruptor alkaliphilus TaxID=427918 RepID=UPI000697AF49|nr:cupin domain-containing protein [Nitriliruptor alkaliphilus]